MTTKSHALAAQPVSTSVLKRNCSEAAEAAAGVSFTSPPDVLGRRRAAAVLLDFIGGGGGGGGKEVDGSGLQGVRTFSPQDICPSDIPQKNYHRGHLPPVTAKVLGLALG